MAGPVPPASDSGPARRAAHPEMAERGRAGKGYANVRGGRFAARRKCIAAAGEYLPPLRLRSLGSSMAQEAGARRCDRGALRRRHRGWIRVQRRGRKVLGGTERTNAEVPTGTAPGEDAAYRVRTPRGGEPKAPRSGQAGDLRFSRLQAHLREDEKGTVSGASANGSQTHAGQAAAGENRVVAAHA